MTTPVPEAGCKGDDEPGLVRYAVLSHRAILGWAVGIVAVGAGVAVWLLLGFTGGDTDADRNQLDAIRTAGTIVIGAGGAAALLLAARRQRSAEIALKQKDRDLADVVRAHALQERIAAATEADAAARRVTDLYTKAIEQLGSDKAPVRLGGLYALERLAQDNPEQRRTVVNVLCAYLRMPYQLPDDPPADDAAADVVAQHRERAQEREIRLTAQRLLTTHLHPGSDPDQPADTFWPGLHLDLTAALLINLDLGGCRIHTATFTNTRFAGDTLFGSAQFSGDAWFDGAQFSARAVLSGAWFGGIAWFGSAQFSRIAVFDGAQFSGDGRFDGTQFGWDAVFGSAQFSGDAVFDSAQFSGGAVFGKAHFSARAVFSRAQFSRIAWFDGAEFSGDAWFDGAEFSGIAGFDRVRFARGVPNAVAQFVSAPAAAGKDEPTESGNG